MWFKNISFGVKTRSNYKQNTGKLSTGTQANQN